MVQHGLFQNPKILYRPEVFFLSCVLQDRRPDGQKVSLDNYLIGLARSRSKTRKFKNRGDMQYRSQFTASACSGTSSSSFKTLILNLGLAPSTDLYGARNLTQECVL